MNLIHACGGLLLAGILAAPGSSCAAAEDDQRLGEAMERPDAPRAAARNADGHELSDGVVVDVARQRVYVMTPERTVRGLDRSGRTVWEYPGSARPLALEGTRLVCQAESPAGERLELVVLDTTRAAEPVVREAALALPQGVNARIEEGLDGTFAVRSSVRGDEAFVYWEFQPRAARGMPVPGGMPGEAPPQRLERKAESARGVVRLELDSGRAVAVEPADLPAALEDPAPWAMELPPRGGDPAGLVSVDGRHVLRSERAADDARFDKHRWTIVERASGEQVGSARSHLARAPFVLLDGVLLYETPPYVVAQDGELRERPRELQAVDLRSGEQAWSQPLRDTAYRGSLPP